MKDSHPIRNFFTVVGALATIGGAAYVIHRYIAPKYLGQYNDDDFEDDFDNYFEDEDLKSE